LLYFGSKTIFGLFISDEEFLNYGDTYLKILSISQLFMIVELATAGAFNGLGKTKFPAFVGILGNLLRIPMALFFSIGIGYAGIWWAISLSSIVKGVVLFTLFIFVLRKVLRTDSEKVEIWYSLIYNIVRSDRYDR